MERKSADLLGIWERGTAEIIGSRGVWVPDGMSGDAILAGAALLKKEFDIGEYSARSVAIDVWKAMSAAMLKSELF